MTTYSGSDFPTLSWHDCHLWGIELRTGNPEEEDWTSDLVLHIDYIAEWLCGADGHCQFRVAPAILIFHHVTDLSIHMDWGRLHFRTALYAQSINEITREPVEIPQIHLDRSYYNWTIQLHPPLNSAAANRITFGATDFTQTLLTEPVLLDEQQISLSQRNKLLGR